MNNKLKRLNNNMLKKRMKKNLIIKIVYNN